MMMRSPNIGLVGQLLRFRPTGDEVRDVPCMDCGRPCEHNEFGEGFAAAFREELSATGQEPLREEELNRCENCSAAYQRKHREASEEESRMLLMIRRASEAQNGQETPAMRRARTLQVIRSLPRDVVRRNEEWIDGIIRGIDP